MANLRRVWIHRKTIRSLHHSQPLKVWGNAAQIPIVFWACTVPKFQSQEQELGGRLQACCPLHRGLFWRSNSNKPCYVSVQRLLHRHDGSSLHSYPRNCNRQMSPNLNKTEKKMFSTLLQCKSSSTIRKTAKLEEISREKKIWMNQGEIWSGMQECQQFPGFLDARKQERGCVWGFIHRTSVFSEPLTFTGFWHLTAKNEKEGALCQSSNPLLGLQNVQPTAAKVSWFGCQTTQGKEWKSPETVVELWT